MKEVRARVILQEKGIYTIRNENGHSKSEVKLAEISGRYYHDVQSHSDYPAVGDYVIAQWPEDESRAVIVALFPRKSCLVRKAAGKEGYGQTVAANVDTVFICMSLNHNFNLRRLERYLAFVYESGAEPVVVLTKADLCEDVDAKIDEVREVSQGAEVVAISALDGKHTPIMQYIHLGKTVAFVGSSGVGKSTLINTLLGENQITTSEIGENDKGRHTTTHRELIALANGSFVIDTPGMRELGMWDSESGIDTTFADIEKLSRRCKYSNCTHRSEPGCAVQKALTEGILSAERLASYQKLKVENEYTADNRRYLETKRQKFKEISKQNKANRKKYSG